MTAEPRTAPPPFETHEVFNQPPPLIDVNLYTGDRPLQDAVEREGAGWAHRQLAEQGAELGRAETIEAGALANRHLPVLQTFDRFGRRRDVVEFHPAWHRMMALGIRYGLHAGPWEDGRAGSHVARAAGVILHAQVEAGTQCPMTMTYGSVPALRRQAEVAGPWLPKILSTVYDERFRPVTEKTGAIVGMGMTEKQGGSDVRSNTTAAEPVGPGGPGREYRITGHKWFLSAPMCDAFLVLAQTQGGLSCFFVPRWLPDGELNTIRLQRLKDKLGNKSNASSEVEFQRAAGWLLGEEGRGVPTILEMGTYTRLDCALGSSGLMRQALSQALHHASYRTAFQRHLVDQPLMANVLADLAIEVEAGIALSLRLARAFDRQSDETEGLFRRLVTPAAKYWVCKRAVAVSFEAMEVLGGNGYVEESPMPRLYRETPVNSIWEGSGNVMCLDVLRAAIRYPRAVEAFFGELALAKGGDARLDAAMGRLRAAFADRNGLEARSRRLVEQMMVALQGALLVRHAPAAVADAFCASRLDGDWGQTFGTLPAGADHRAVIDRARIAA